MNMIQLQRVACKRVKLKGACSLETYFFTRPAFWHVESINCNVCVCVCVCILLCVSVCPLINRPGVAGAVLPRLVLLCLCRTNMHIIWDDLNKTFDTFIYCLKVESLMFTVLKNPLNL